VIETLLAIVIYAACLAAIAAIVLLDT